LKPNLPRTPHGPKPTTIHITTLLALDYLQRLLQPGAILHFAHAKATVSSPAVAPKAAAKCSTPLAHAQSRGKRRFLSPFFTFTSPTETPAASSRTPAPSSLPPSAQRRRLGTSTPPPPFLTGSPPAEGPQEKDVGGGAPSGAGSTPRLRRESAATGRVRRQPGGAGAGQPQSAREQGRSSLRDRGQRRRAARLRSSDWRSRGTSRGRSRGTSRRSGLRHPPPPARAAGADPSGRTRCRGEEVAPPRWTGLPHPRRRARSRLVPILVGASTTRSRGGCLGRRQRGGPLGGDDEAGDNEAAWGGDDEAGPTFPDCTAFCPGEQGLRPPSPAPRTARTSPTARGSTPAGNCAKGMGKTAGVPPLLQQGMPLSAAAYSSVLQMREGHPLEIVLEQLQ
jgi:hypothetical protein